MLYEEAVISGLQCGFGLGILVALINAALTCAQQKVHVEGEDGVKYFYLSAIAFCTIVGIIILARPFVAPYMLQMQDLLNRSLAEIGFGLFNLLILAGAATVAIPAMVLIVLPIRILHSYLKERADRQNEKTDNAAN